MNRQNSKFYTQRKLISVSPLALGNCPHNLDNSKPVCSADNCNTVFVSCLHDFGNCQHNFIVVNTIVIFIMKMLIIVYTV